MRKYYKDFPLEWNEKTVTERRLAMRRWICDWGKAKGQFKNGHTYITTEQSPIYSSERLQSLERLQRLQSLESLQSLQSLERLESLQRLQRLEIYPYKDYRDIEIKPNSIIYCDIPYRNTNQGGYAKYNFDYDSFYEWCRKQTAPVFISEYSMPDDFKVFASFPKRQLSGSNGAGKIVSENIYTL